MGILLQFLLGFCCYELFAGSGEVMGAPTSPSPIRIVMKVNDFRGFNVYTGAITLGTPPKSFNVFIDTSSADFAIRSTALLTPNFANRVYDSKKSSTFKQTTCNVEAANVSTAYSDYTSFPEKFGSGFLSTDTLGIGSAAVKDQTFIELTKVSSSGRVGSDFQDGILGLAFPKASTTGATPFFQNMIQQGLVSNPTFAIAFNNTNGNFELTLGAIDSWKSITWTPVTEQRYWKFSVAYLSVRFSPCNVTRINCSNPNGCQMVIDSRSEEIYGSYTDLSKIGPFIGSDSFSGYQGVPCNMVNSLPDIGFNIGGKDFYMTPAQYMMRGSINRFCTNPSTKSAAWTVFYSWTPKDKFNNNAEVWILGTPFLRAFYAAFDVGNNRIGFA